jgi:hypothetical protein
MGNIPGRQIQSLVCSEFFTLHHNINKECPFLQWKFSFVSKKKNINKDVGIENMQDVLISSTFG